MREGQRDAGSLFGLCERQGWKVQSSSHLFPPSIRANETGCELHSFGLGGSRGGVEVKEEVFCGVPASV